MWKKEIIPLDENVYIWITAKKDRLRNSPIVIETKSDKVVVVNYSTDAYSLDIDRKDK